ncbi:glycosyltransferase family 2 protein [Deinococcus yavapaiensis]|nr:glycosyltransferase family 2 protein [Deinococcus yavapaiensis]
MAKNYEIVVATYNGAPFLSAQLDSLLPQLGLAGWITIRDDGSSDDTSSLIEDYARQYPAHIRVLSGAPSGSARDNFGLLLQNATADYVFCSDQDDVWLPDKVERLLRVMLEHEISLGPSTPLLVHSDLLVVNDNMHILANSLWRYQKLDPTWGNSFALLLTQNVVTGCAMLVNRALLEAALPVPIQAVMHDWWLALVACALGRVVAVPEPLVYYRQHGQNDVGAKRFNAHYILNRFTRLRSGEVTGLARLSLQAEAFAIRFDGTSSASTARMFAQLPRLPRWQRRLQIVHHGFWKVGFARNLGWLLWA